MTNLERAEAFLNTLDLSPAVHPAQYESALAALLDEAERRGVERILDLLKHGVDRDGIYTMEASQEAGRPEGSK